jgi:hypothetical protein
MTTLGLFAWVSEAARDRRRGIDPRPVTVTTDLDLERDVPRDIHEPELLHAELRRMAERSPASGARARPRAP